MKSVLTVLAVLLSQLSPSEGWAARGGVDLRQINRSVNVFPYTSVRRGQQIDHGHPIALPAGSIFSTQPLPTPVSGPLPGPAQHGPSNLGSQLGSHFGAAHGGIVMGQSQNRLIYAPTWSPQQVHQFNSQKYLFMMKYLALSQMVQPSYVRKKIRERRRYRSSYRLEASFDPLPLASLEVASTALPRIKLPATRKSRHFEFSLRIGGKSDSGKEVAVEATSKEDTSGAKLEVKKPATQTDSEEETKTEKTEVEKDDKTAAGFADTSWLSPIENSDCTLDEKRFGCFADEKEIKDKDGKSKKRFTRHNGWDLNTGSSGKNVVAPVDCKIEKVNDSTSPTGKGRQMFLDCQGYKVVLSHLKSFTKKKGTVKRGKIIAVSGETGNTKEYALEVSLKKDGKYIDPSEKFSAKNICKKQEIAKKSDEKGCSAQAKEKDKAKEPDDETDAATGSKKVAKAAG